MCLRMLRRSYEGPVARRDRIDGVVNRDAVEAEDEWVNPIFRKANELYQYQKSE